MQQGCVDDAVDGGGGPDAEGHGGDDNEGKSRGPVEHANRIAEIEEKILSKWKTLLGVVLLAYGLGCAKLQCGLPARLGGDMPARKFSSVCKARCSAISSWNPLVGAPSLR